MTDRNISKPHTVYDPDKLVHALLSAAGVLEKATTIQDVNAAGHQLRVMVKQARIKA